MNNIQAGSNVVRASNEIYENKITLNRHTVNHMLHKPYQIDFAEVKKIEFDCERTIEQKRKERG